MTHDPSHLPMPRIFPWLMGAGAIAWAAFVLTCGLGGCAALRQAERAPCPPHELVSIDARFAAEAIATCKAEGPDVTAATCKALPAIRAKYAREREAWVTCAPKGTP